MKSSSSICRPAGLNQTLSFKFESSLSMHHVKQWPKRSVCMRMSECVCVCVCVFDVPLSLFRSYSSWL